jgi:hypothetical protein
MILEKFSLAETNLSQRSLFWQIDKKYDILTEVSLLGEECE